MTPHQGYRPESSPLRLMQRLTARSSQFFLSRCLRGRSHYLRLAGLRLIVASPRNPTRLGVGNEACGASDRQEEEHREMPKPTCNVVSYRIDPFAMSTFEHA